MGFAKNSYSHIIDSENFQNNNVRIPPDCFLFIEPRGLGGSEEPSVDFNKSYLLKVPNSTISRSRMVNLTIADFSYIFHIVISFLVVLEEIAKEAII